MLDEISEYGFYTGDIEGLLADELAGRALRLSRRRFRDNSFDGISRAMEVIARKHLFADGHSDWPDSGRMRDVERILKIWCCCDWEDLDEDARDFYDAWQKDDPVAATMRCWVKNYISALYDTEAAKSKSKGGRSRAEGEKEAKLADFERRVHGKEGSALSYSAALCDQDSHWTNDQNRVTYQRVIANALRQGPLKRRYLVGRSELLDVIDASARKLNRRNYSTVLGLTAMILMQDGYNRKEGFVEVSPGRLQDWRGVEHDFEKNGVLGWRFAGRPLFLSESIGSSSSVWHIDEGWLSQGCWQLVDADDSEAIGKAYGAVKERRLSDADVEKSLLRFKKAYDALEAGELPGGNLEAIYNVVRNNTFICDGEAGSLAVASGDSEIAMGAWHIRKIGEGNIVPDNVREGLKRGIC